MCETLSGIESEFWELDLTRIRTGLATCQKKKKLQGIPEHRNERKKEKRELQ